MARTPPNQRYAPQAQPGGGRSSPALLPPRQASTLTGPAQGFLTNSEFGGAKASTYHRRVNIEDIQGISDVYSHKLRAAGIVTSETLLERGGKRIEREKLARETGINEALILKWVNRADLMRVKGIGSEYSDLLEAAGVDSPLELRHRIPEHLFRRLEEVNTAKHLVRRLPTEHEVEEWVMEAGALPKSVEH